MNIHQIRDLALKILGIYYLSRALVYAPQLASLFFSWDKRPEMDGHGVSIALSVLVPLAFWLIIGLLLTFRTGVVTNLLWSSRDEPETSTIAKPSMRFWIVLIGFFFLVSSTGGVVVQIWVIVDKNIQGAVMYFRFLPEVVTLVLSVVCIIKARAIESWLKTKIEEDSQQGHLQRPGEGTPPGA